MEVHFNMMRKVLQDAEFKHLLSLLPPVNMQTGPWITGGSARRLWQGEDWHTGDVDVFFTSGAQRAQWLLQFNQVWDYTYERNKLKAPSLLDRITPHKQADTVILLGDRSVSMQDPTPQAHVKMETDNAITFDLHYVMPGGMQIQSAKLQVIKVRDAQSLTELWQGFDFNVCCFAADDEHLYADPAALEDVQLNQITRRNPENSQNMPLRVFKHFSQGYHVPDHMILEAMKRIAEGEVDWCNNY
jgi:hypothetical protein